MTDTSTDENAAAQGDKPATDKPATDKPPAPRARKPKPAPIPPYVTVATVLDQAARPSQHTDDVRHVQAALIDEGHLDAEPDGFYGAATRAALRAYAEEHGHATTARALSALGRGRFRVVNR